MARSVATLALAALMLACGDEPEAFVPLPANYAISYVVHAARDGTLQVNGPHGPGIEAPPARIELDEERAVYLVGIEESALEREVPMQDRTRRNDTALIVGAEACEAGRFSTTEVSVPARGLANLERFDGARFVAAEAEDARMLDGLRVSVPYAHERCVDRPTTLAPFGDRVELLDASTMIDGRTRTDITLTEWRDLLQAVFIDEDRVLAISNRAVFLFDRNEPWRDEPTKLRTLSSLDLSAQALAIDPTTRGQPETRAAIAAHRMGPGDDRTGAVLWVAVDENGLSDVQTATIVSGSSVHDIAFDPTGHYLAVGGNEVTVTATSIRARPTVGRIGVGMERVDVVIWTDDPELGFVTGSENGVVQIGGPDRFRIDQPDTIISTITGLTSRKTDEGTELIAGTFNSDVFVRRPSGEWRAAPLVYPEDAQGCTAAPNECGNTRLKDPEGMSISPGGQVFLLPIDCDVVFEANLEVGCARGIEVFGDASLYRPGARRRWWSSRMGHHPRGHSILCGRDGLLLEAPAD